MIMSYSEKDLAYLEGKNQLSNFNLPDLRGRAQVEPEKPAQSEADRIWNLIVLASRGGIS